MVAQDIRAKRLIGLERRMPEGKAQQIAATVEGRRRWVERMKAEGKKFPGGRKSGPEWITPQMRERDAEEAWRLGAAPRTALC